MLAAWYERNGAARDVLTVGETEPAAPGPGEVRVRIHASGVNPSDVKARAGRPLGAPRVIPHSDGAGVIDAVGKGVDHARTGERVWLWNARWKRPFGTAAQYCTVPSEQAVALPAAVPFAVGACLGIPLMTALQALRVVGPVSGRTLLVTGAGSSVGHYVTQIARARGARVIGTASERRADHARAAGAAFVVDHTRKDVAKVVKDLTQGRGADAVVDMDFSSGAQLLAAGALAPHGVYACYGSNVAGAVSVDFPSLLWNNISLRFFLVYELKPEDRKAALGEIAAILEAGGIRHALGPRFPLTEIVAAHETVEKGEALGNVVVDVA